MEKAARMAGVVLAAILCVAGAALSQDPGQGSQVVVRGGMREGGLSAAPAGQQVVVRSGRREEEGFGGLLAGDQMAGEALALLENDRVKAYLNLTDQQVDRLRQILVETEKASVKMRAEMTVRRIELRELLRPDKADHDAVMNKARELSDLEGQMMRQHVEALLAAKAVLTPEQQKKIRSFIASRAAFGGLGERWGIRLPQATTPRAPTPPLVPGRPGEPPVQ